MRIHGRDSACSIKLFYIIVVVPAFIIIFHGQICNAQVPLCNQNFNYTKGSEFESNLKKVFNSLVQHTSQTGFNTSVYGQRPNQIYGLLQCRGDTTAAQCYSCSQGATTTIRQSCGNGVGGRIYLDMCYLRYENYSFIGQLDTSGWYLYNQLKISKPDVFNAAVKKLFSELSAEATSGSKLYASGSTVDSLSRKIYGLVQCWRDISISNCTTCLSKTINSTLASFGGSPGARGLMGSCTIRYKAYSFFNSTALAPAPAEAPLAPTPADTPLAPAPAEAPLAPTPADTPLAPAPAEAPLAPAPAEAPLAPTPADTPLAPAPAEAPLAPAPADTPLADTGRHQTLLPRIYRTKINHSDQKSSNKITLILGVVGGLLLV